MRTVLSDPWRDQAARRFTIEAAKGAGLAFGMAVGGVVGLRLVGADV